MVGQSQEKLTKGIIMIQTEINHSSTTENKMKQEQKQIDPNALFKALEEIVMDGKQPTPRMANEVMKALSEALTLAYGQKGDVDEAEQVVEGQQDLLSQTT